ncbi:MAG TPA: NAD(P)/FAD-dependent oxidoreductase [Ktedonobacterales bacterium]|jgi:phytoene dehydrogenase-like protein
MTTRSASQSAQRAQSAHPAYDAAVIGAGPNGLAAAITLAQAGRSVVVFEAADTIGGGCRTKELTLPGFRHDVCSAIHPLAAASPFFRTLPLARYGLEWIYPPAALAHPLPDGRAALLGGSVAATAATLGEDAAAYIRLMAPFVVHWPTISDAVSGPLRPLHYAAHPIRSLALVPFALGAAQSARGFAQRHFTGARARGLFAGMAAHSMIPLDAPPTAGFGLILGVSGHAVGWPLPRGGSQAIVDALAAHLRALGGEIVTNSEITALDQLPQAEAIIADITPRQLLRIAGDRLPAGYQRQLARYRYGPGVFKVDYALDGPIPWTAPECAQAGTVHLGGTLDEIAASEHAVTHGVPPERPFILLAQQSLFDPTRAPAGQHTAWAYCHVPAGSSVDMTTRIEAQIERFAPGFRDRILARHTLNAAQMEAYNANYVGGDINGGVQDLWQFFTRPTMSLVPYATPARGLYLCSSSTPPGGGVHGMCGYYAAQTVLHGRARLLLDPAMAPAGHERAPSQPIAGGVG